MSDENQGLAIPQTNTVAKYATDEAFDDLAKSGDFLPRFQLYGSNSNACKEGKIGIGRYGYLQGKDTIIDCTQEVRCFALSFRLKAMRIDEAAGKVEVYFNPAHPEFGKIKAESAERDTGSLCGPEFLLYIPEKKVFVTFFMANKTMRREAPNVKLYVPSKDNGGVAKPMTLKSTLIKKGQYSWHGPVVTGCSIPLDAPDADRLAKELEKFNNPPEKQDEAATTEEQQSQDRAR